MKAAGRKRQAGKEWEKARAQAGEQPSAGMQKGQRSFFAVGPQLAEPKMYSIFHIPMHYFIASTQASIHASRFADISSGEITAGSSGVCAYLIKASGSSAFLFTG